MKSSLPKKKKTQLHLITRGCMPLIEEKPESNQSAGIQGLTVSISLKINYISPVLWLWKISKSPLSTLRFFHQVLLASDLPLILLSKINSRRSYCPVRNAEAHHLVCLVFPSIFQNCQFQSNLWNIFKVTVYVEVAAITSSGPCDRQELCSVQLIT